VTSPIAFPGDADAGGRDDVAADVSSAMGNAQARYREHEALDVAVAHRDIDKRARET